jgi:hypothetical protein
MYHVIFPSLQCFRMKILCLIMQGWNLVFRLPAAGEVGGQILFRLRVLNYVWILIPAVENKGPPCCNACVWSIATRVLLGF